MKIEKQVKDAILEEILSLKKGKTASISGIKNINAIKEIADETKCEINVYNPRGEWNGYGYTREPLVCEFPKTKIKHFLEKIETIKTKPPKTEYDKTLAWCRRLSKLSGITLEEAKEIAEEKIEYKEDRIQAVEERATESAYKLAKKMARANPLRRIENEEHAIAIISASNRHNYSNYEDKLEEGRELKMFGEIEDAREYARNNFSY